MNAGWSWVTWSCARRNRASYGDLVHALKGEEEHCKNVSIEDQRSGSLLVMIEGYAAGIPNHSETFLLDDEYECRTVPCVPLLEVQDQLPHGCLSTLPTDR